MNIRLVPYWNVNVIYELDSRTEWTIRLVPYWNAKESIIEF